MPSSQLWMTFVRNHAQAILVSDFFTTVTASFRVLYAFAIMEVGTRRIVHFNGAMPVATPTADASRGARHITRQSMNNRRRGALASVDEAARWSDPANVQWRTVAFG